MANAGNGAATRFNVKEAAAYVGLAMSTLNRMRQEGRGPRYVKLGTRVFYRCADLDQYLKGKVIETSDSRAAA
ncbi:helix-turn-helix domain-containing protein [Lysobacter firmicutimachus]|uniref:Helix-turn-helix domain-containing protein n=1 Tax=Lysobacter firmicutimachus TaxID=1792846 RepID=A0AAU8MUX2_9GAMM